MRVSLKADPEKPGIKQVFVDGVRDAETWAFLVGKSLSLWVWPGPLMKRLLATPVAKYPKRLLASELTLLLREPLGCEYVTSVELKPNTQELHLRFAFNTHEWKGDWSISEYVTTFRRAFEEQGIENARLNAHDPKSPSIELAIGAIERTEPFAVNLERIAEMVRRLHNETQRRLDMGTIAIRFQFPELIRNACVQYLVYFAEFLRDMGVEVASRITNTPGAVLFSVTPSDSEQALSAIRDALDLYLSLPNSPITAVRSDDLVAQKLIANVRHLESQLTLARAISQAQSATIEALEVTLEHTRYGESRSVLTNAVAVEDREEVFGGTVAITQYEGKGFEINLAKMLRKLRQIFSRER